MITFNLKQNLWKRVLSSCSTCSTPMIMCTLGTALFCGTGLVKCTGIKWVADRQTTRRPSGTDYLRLCVSKGNSIEKITFIACKAFGFLYGWNVRFHRWLTEMSNIILYQGNDSEKRLTDLSGRNYSIYFKTISNSPSTSEKDARIWEWIFDWLFCVA